jgi:hypothetical protein
LKDFHEEAGNFVGATGHTMHILNVLHYACVYITVDEGVSFRREMKYVNRVLHGENLSRLLCHIMLSSIIRQINLKSVRLLMYTDSTLTTSANPQQTDIFWQPKKIGLIFSGLG